MKKNNKGYMLVEIIVSFSLTFVIMISLINLVLSFKDKNNDLYFEAKYLKDKNLITRNIMNDINKITIKEVLETEGVITLVHTDGVTTEETRRLQCSDNTISYGKYNNGLFDTNDISYYSKKLESSLTIDGIVNCSKLDEGYFCVKIKVTSLYSDENYDITLFSTNVKNS